MKDFKNTYRQHKIFFTGLLLFFVVIISMLFFSFSPAAIISSSAYHSFWMNVFFVNYTFFGNGIFALSLAVICIFYFKKKQTGISILISFLLSFILIQFLKNIFTASAPAFFTEPLQHLFFNEPATGKFSFISPSSYTATAFSIAAILALNSKSVLYQLLLLTAAVLVGYSRIYLVQNSGIDILAGAIAGSVSGIVVFSVVKSRALIKEGIVQLHKINNAANIAEIQPG
ncbi:MAG: phosphatase PAP2 family protein [Ferruginibacter sp.]